MRKNRLAGSLRCFKCGEEYYFPSGDGMSYCYSLGEKRVTDNYIEHNAIPIITKPVWCYDCNTVSAAEDIPSIREFEMALVAVKNGAKLEQPLNNTFLDAETSYGQLEKYIEWRLNRTSKERCLYCGKHNFTVVDEEGELFIHETCEDGVMFFKPVPQSARCGRTVSRLYTAEGEFIDEGESSSWDSAFIYCK